MIRRTSSIWGKLPFQILEEMLNMRKFPSVEERVLRSLDTPPSLSTLLPTITLKNEAHISGDNEVIMTQNAKNFVSRMLSMMVSFLGTMLIARIVVQGVGGEMYGFFQMANDFVSYATVLTVALNGMATRFITVSYVQNDYRQANEYYNSVLFGNFLLTLFIGVPGGLLLANLPSVVNLPPGFESDVRLLFLLTFANFGLTICTTVFSTATYVKNRIDLDSFRNMEREAIRVMSIAILCRAFSPKIWYMGVAILLGNIFVAFRNYAYTLKLVPEIRLFRLDCFNLRKIRQLLSLGAWVSLMSVSSILMDGVDLILANRFVSAAAMGAISLSKTIPRYLVSGMVNVTAVFSPSVMIAYAKGDKNKLVETCVSAIHVGAAIFLPIDVILIVAGKSLFRLWLPSQDADFLHTLLVIALAGYLLPLPLNILWTLFTATNTVRLSSIYMTADSILTIFIVLFLLHAVPDELTKIYIIVGTSSAVQIIRCAFFLPYFSAKVIDVRRTTFYEPVARILICLCLSCGVGFALWGELHAETWGAFFLLCFLLVGETFAMIAIILLSRAEREKLFSKITGIMKRGGVGK